MASPRAIIGLGRLAPHSPQCVRNIRLLGSPKTPVRKSPQTQKTDCEELLKSCSLSPFNIDTPNRMKILKNGLSDIYSPNILGSGGFGRVIQASYKGNQVAAKLIRRRKDSDSSVIAEKHATSLRHDNIIRILGIEQGPALSMITMELCGKSLQERLDESPMNRAERVDVLKAVAQALKFCHNAGVVHADIKPKNILIAADGKPKLTDFGSSFVLGEENERSGVRGTPGYVAPEVIRGHPPCPYSDVYSLGVTTWQMLSRKFPFAKMHAHTILYLTGKGVKPENEELDDNLNGEYKILYRKMWTFEREERPGIAAVINDLERFHGLSRI